MAAPTSAPTAVPCPICDSDRPGDYRLIGTVVSRRTGQPFRVLRCRVHGVEMADVRPADAAERARSATVAAALTTQYGQSQRERARASRMLDAVESVAPSRGTLHDVGCGVGALLAEAASRGWDVQGSDLNQLLVEQVRETGFRCEAGTLSALDLPPASYDVVTSYCVLPHHVADPNPELEAVFAMLRPGGWFVLELPTNGIYRRTAKALYRLSGRRWSWVLSHLYVPGGHTLAYDAASISAHLAGIGFDDIRVRPFRHSPYYTTGRLRKAKWWKAIPAIAAVYAAYAASFLPGFANHMLVFARRPPQTQ